MKKLYALCLITLFAVLIDIVFFHSAAVNAQATTRYQVFGFQPNNSSFNATGTIIGFSCVESNGVTSCYVVTR